MEELVHLVVGPGNHLGGSRTPPPVAGGGLLRDRGLHEGGPASGGQVGQLECQLGVLDDGIGQHLLVPLPDVVAPLDNLGVFGNVGAAAKKVAGTDMLKVKELAMLVALVPESKVDTRAALGGRPNEVGHYP